ncbi:MAG: hypothetical protein SF187_28130 [Deltaproteobacteria bacterium]|nr:hypothetical protein [Deltaproteobacteria bacterium]
MSDPQPVTLGKPLTIMIRKPADLEWANTEIVVALQSQSTGYIASTIDLRLSPNNH